MNKRGGEKTVKKKTAQKARQRKAKQEKKVKNFMTTLKENALKQNRVAAATKIQTAARVKRNKKIVANKRRNKAANASKVKKTTKPKTAKTLRKQVALYGLSQKQFKKELENIGYQFNEVKNAKINKNKNLVYVGTKGYKIFSPLNSNKKYQLKSNNTLNPYKIAINNYNKSVRNTNPIPRAYPNKKSYFNALSAALSDDNNFNKKKLKYKGKKKPKTNSLKNMGKQIEANVMAGGKRGAKQQKRKKLKKAIQKKKQFYNELIKGQKVFVKAFSGKRKGASNNNPRIAQWFPGKIISVSNGKIKKYEVEVNNLSSNQKNGIGYNNLGPNMTVVVGKSCIANINSPIIQSKAFRKENTNNGKRYVRNKNNGTKIVRPLKSRNKLTNKLSKEYKK